MIYDDEVCDTECIIMIQKSLDLINGLNIFIM